MLSHVDLDKACEFYRSRFADASDLTFLFVGSFSPSEIRPLVEQYVASLPSTNSKVTWRDIGLRPPRGVIKKEVRKGIEPKSVVWIVFSGPSDWTEDTRTGLTGLSEVLRIKLREVIREEKGGTYGVSVGGYPIHYPTPEYRFSISFGCSPDRVEELVRTVFGQIDSLRNFPPDISYIAKVKETLRRGQETMLKQNQFWMSSLQFCLSNGEDPRSILAFEERLQLITPEAVRRAAEKFLDPLNYVQVVLIPETEKR